MNGDEFRECVVVTNSDEREKIRRLEQRPANPRASSEKEAAIAKAYGVDRDDAVADAELRRIVGTLPLPDPHDEPAIASPN